MVRQLAYLLCLTKQVLCIFYVNALYPFTLLGDCEEPEGRGRKSTVQILGLYATQGSGYDHMTIRLNALITILVPHKSTEEPKSYA